jgi:hypothetical protein
MMDFFKLPISVRTPFHDRGLEIPICPPNCPATEDEDGCPCASSVGNTTP